MNAPVKPVINTDNANGQYLTFALAGEEYGVDILKVQEIKGWSNVTPVPNTSEHVLGVINLRGTVVPIIDLRLRFALAGSDFGPTTVIIVMRHEVDGRSKSIGVVVDGVSEVYRFTEQQIRPCPNLGSRISLSFIRGVATIDEKIIILLGLEELFEPDSTDFEVVRTAKSEQPA